MFTTFRKKLITQFSHEITYYIYMSLEPELSQLLNGEKKSMGSSL